ncbi:MAG: pilus assembly protein PilP [Desulfotalea sp.]
MTTNYYILKRLKLCLATCLIAALATPCIAKAEEKKTSQPVEELASFEYQLDGRHDPFIPFLKDAKKSPTVDMNEILDSNDKLVGMQIFEPDQLKVVGVIVGKSKKIAMVQDGIGQGYNIGIGTLIGKRGMVTEISKQGVIVEETAKTRAGKKITTQRVMTLKPEGE